LTLKLNKTSLTSAHLNMFLQINDQTFEYQVNILMLKLKLITSITTN